MKGWDVGPSSPVLYFLKIFFAANFCLFFLEQQQQQREAALIFINDTCGVFFFILSRRTNRDNSWDRSCWTYLIDQSALRFVYRLFIKGHRFVCRTGDKNKTKILQKKKTNEWRFRLDVPPTRLFFFLVFFNSMEMGFILFH